MTSIRQDLSPFEDDSHTYPTIVPNKGICELDATQRKSLKENTMYRVQMVSSGIGAYQNDFADKGEALATAERLANGAKAPKVEASEDIAHYATRRTVVRLFDLSGGNSYG